MSAGKSEVATSLDCVGADACKASVQQYIPTSSHGGMRPILQSDNPDVWVKHSDYAALESLLLDARADSADWERLALKGAFATVAARERAERAEALAGEYQRDALRYRWLRENEWDHPIVTLTYGDYDHLAGAELDAAIDAIGGRVAG